MNSEIISKIDDNLDCKDVISHVCENLGEPDNSPFCISVREHLQHCQNCDNFKHQISKIVELYQNYNVEMPENCHENLLKFLGLTDDCMNKKD